MSDSDEFDRDTQERILETLLTMGEDIKKISERLDNLESRQKKLEEKMNKLAMDTDTIHKFQRSFAERLSAVEQFCVDLPLMSASASNSSGG